MSNFDKGLHFPLNAPINAGDTEKQTYGCRHSNPDICGSCYINNICAFATDDHICRKPSAAWKKFFKKLCKDESDE